MARGLAVAVALADTAPPWWSLGADAVAVDAAVKSVAVSVASLVAVVAGGVEGFNIN